MASLSGRHHPKDGTSNAMKKIEINKDLKGENQEYAAANRELFLKHGMKVVNIMSSPGSGKTALLEKTAAHFQDKLKLAVLVGDISTNRDAERIKLAAGGVQSEQIVTEKYGSACHLDARMISEALPRIDFAQTDILVIENVGNLVCPAGLYLGEDKRVVLLSVPEGDDKVKKYPVMFREAELLLITKMDLICACDFDPKKVEAEAREIKGEIEVLRLSAKTGEGLAEWYQWIDRLESRATSYE